MAIVKPQPTLKGYVAWAFLEFIAARGVTQAEGAAWIVDQWIQENQETLLKEYGIDPAKFQNYVSVKERFEQYTSNGTS